MNRMQGGLGSGHRGLARRWNLRSIVAVAAAQLVGMGVMFAAFAGVGRQDSYGDYPAAFGIGLVVTAALSALRLVVGNRRPNERDFDVEGSG